jgi:ribosomal protein S12 methylthiotransferase accessory factor
MDKLGLVSINDLTDYASLFIPVYAIERTSEDGRVEVISYGKGVNHTQSKVSAMMEAIERFTANLLPSTIIYETYTELRKKNNVVIPGGEADTVGDVLIGWLPGTDLLSQLEVWVPAYDVLLSGEVSSHRQVDIRTTNGLASGNIIEEAVCHALYELIERDAWTLAWLGSVTVPQMRYMAQRIRAGDMPGWNNSFSLQSDIIPIINNDSLPHSAQLLIERFTKSGASIVVRDITSDIGVATIIVAGCDKSTLFYGIGTHLSSHIALMRAITECAQSRQALTRSEQILDDTSLHIQEIKRNLLFKSSPIIQFDALPNYNIRDTILEIEVILSHLSKVGLDKVIVVDITHSGLGIPVVRALIPGVENWSTFGFSSSCFRLGYRGQNYLMQQI